jgi:hypothetical protein
MNKRLKNLLAIFVLALCVVLYLNNKDRGNVSNDKREFSIGDLSSVSQVYLSTEDDEQIVLKLENEEWRANGNLVRKQKINKIKQVVTGLTVKNRVSAVLADSLQVAFTNTSILVKYMNNEKELLSYKVLVDIQNPNELIVLAKGSNTPFYAHVFGEEINFSALFSTRISAWSSLVVADFTTSKITKVCSSNPQLKDSVFCVLVNDTVVSFSMDGANISGVNMKKGIDYLRNFKQIKAKKMFSNKKVIRELIGDEKPFFVLTIYDSNIKTKLFVFKKQAGLNQVDFAGKALKYDNEYFYIKSKGNLYLMDYFSFDEYMKTAKDFLNE